MKKPPKKLSALIRLALADMAVVQKNKKYSISMNGWHYTARAKSGEATVCRVCFAGAVMANTLGVGFLTDTSPDALSDHEWAKALYALDWVRSGSLRTAYAELRRPRPMSIPAVVEVTEYFLDKVQWRKDMLKIARLLEAEGE